jgi:predicted nucleotidyltransferase
MSLEVLDLEKVLPDIVERIVAEFHPEKIILFGSYARGTQYRHSDLDLMIVMPEGVEQTETALAIRRLLRHVPVGKDIVVTTESDFQGLSKMVDTLHRQVAEDGKVVYDAQRD